MIYLIDITKVPDFKYFYFNLTLTNYYFSTMYELYDPVTVMFFYRNKHMMIDLGTGNNNKINWAMTDK